MPFALLMFGLVLLASAIAGTQNQFLSLIIGDFSGPSNFFYWVVALVIIGAVGYIPKLKPVSDLFLILIILVLLLSKGKPSAQGGGFFKQFTAALSSTNQKVSSGSTGIIGGTGSTLDKVVTTGQNIYDTVFGS